MKKIQGLVLLIIGIALVAGEGCRREGVTDKGGGGVIIRSEKRDGQEFLIMENQFVRVGLTPGRGAHITEFTLKANGCNILYNGHDRWEGYTDILDQEHPGPDIQTKPYSVSRQQSPSQSAITCGYTCGDVRLERTMSLQADSSALEIIVRLTNKGSQPMALCYGAHICLAMGGSYSASDVVFWPQGKAIQRWPVTYLGYDAPQFFEEAPAWLAFLDVRRDMVVLDFSLKGRSQSLIWKGLPSQIPQAYYRWENVPPGDFREARCRLGVVHGISELGGVGESAVASLKTDRVLYGNEDVMQIECVACSWQGRPPGEAVVRISSWPDGRIVWSSRENLGAIPAGGSTQAAFQWHTADAADGDYMVELKDGDVRASTTFRIDGKMMNPVIQAMSECRKKLQEGKMEKGAHDRAELLLRDAQVSLQAGLHDRAGEQLAQARNLFQKGAP